MRHRKYVSFTRNRQLSYESSSVSAESALALDRAIEAAYPRWIAPLYGHRYAESPSLDRDNKRNKECYTPRSPGKLCTSWRLFIVRCQMEIDWDALAHQYQELVISPTNSEQSSAIQKLIGKAASTLPKDNSESLTWFRSALNQSPNKWFVAKVMALAKPVPRSMLDPLVLAALLEPNPSATKNFIEPCVRSFGVKTVKNRIQALSNEPGVSQNDGVQKATYWLPSIRS